MKKRFESINELHSYIEKAAKRTIKHYYTDFKNYDRPGIMKATGNREKECYLILRDCGSYFYTRSELTDIRSDWPATVMDYYTNDTSARYFKIDFNSYVIENIPAGLPDEIKKEREYQKRQAAA